MTDAVTGLVKESTLVSQGTMYGAITPVVERIDRSADISSRYDKWTMICYTAPAVGDIINGRVVQRVEAVSGLYTVELEP